MTDIEFTFIQYLNLGFDIKPILNKCFRMCLIPLFLQELNSNTIENSG